MRDETATLVQRHNMDKKTVPQGDLATVVQGILDNIQKELWEHASEELKKGIRTVEDLKDAKSGINRMGWCGEESCGHEIEDITDMSVLGTLYDGEDFEGKCAACGNPAMTAAYVARTY